MRITLYSTVAWATLVPAGALAQPAGDQAVAAARGQDPENTPQAGVNSFTDVIIVTARKRAEAVTDVPIAITALGSERLAEANIKDAYGLQSAVPNLTVSSSSNSAAAVATFSLRGQLQESSGASFDQPIGVYYDGVAVPRAIAFSPALIDLDRVEVLRGPQGTLYGRNTTGGAVSVYSRTPNLDQFSGFVSGEYGRFNTWKLTGAVNVPIVPEALAGRITASYGDSDGFGRSAVERLGQLKQQYYRGKLRFDNGGPFKASLMVDYARIEGTNNPTSMLNLVGLSGNLPGQASAATISTAAAVQIGALSPADLATTATGNPTGATPAQIAAARTRIAAALPLGLAAIRQGLLPGRPTGGTFTGGFWDNNTTLRQPLSADRLGGALNLSLDITDQLSVTSISGYQKANRDAITELDGTAISILENEKAAQSTEFKSQELQLAYAGSRLNVIVGGYYSVEEGDDDSISRSLNAINAVTNSNIIDYRYVTWGVFGQADYELADNLKVTAGIRYSKERKRANLQNSRTNRNTGVVSCRLAASFNQVPAPGCSATVEGKFDDISWLASLDYKPIEPLLLYVKAARGFRGGGVNFRATNANEAAPFAPELVNEYEAGAKFVSEGRAVQLNLAVFYDKYKDIQRNSIVAVTNPDGSTAVATAVTNAAAATIWGIEADFILRPSDRWEFSGQLGYLNAGYDDYLVVNQANPTGPRLDVSDTPFAVPEITLGVAAKYTLPTQFGSAFARISYDMISDRVLTDQAVDRRSATQDGYGLLGGRLQLNFEALDANIALFGTNLLNQKYYINAFSVDSASSALGFTLGYPGTPRTYGISFTKRFGND